MSERAPYEVHVLKRHGGGYLLDALDLEHAHRIARETSESGRDEARVYRVFGPDDLQRVAVYREGKEV